MSSLRFVFFEPKTVGNRQETVAKLVQDCAVPSTVVGVKDGEVKVKVEGSVDRDVCGGAGWLSFADPNALPLRSNLVC